MKYIGSTTRKFLPEVRLEELSSDELQFRTARYQLMSKLIEKGFYACIVYAGSYQGKGVFSKHLYPVNETTLSFEERGEVHLDALYDKTKLYPSDMPHITDREVGMICNDKGRTNAVFADLQPWSMLVENRENLEQCLRSKQNESKIVVKPLEGHGGAHIRIKTVDEVRNMAPSLSYPFLVQEFIESSYGVPGLVAGRHDVRVLLLNGEVLGGSVRQPSPGGYLSNTHQGGSMRMLDIDELPSELVAFSKIVDARLPQKPRLYAADFMYSQPQKKWFLIELNGSPGALPSDFGPVGARFQQKLADTLMALTTS